MPRIAEKEMKSINDGVDNDQYDVEGQFQDLVEHKGHKSKVSEPLRQCNEVLKVSSTRLFVSSVLICCRRMDQFSVFGMNLIIIFLYQK